MITLHTQDIARCENVQVDNESKIIRLTGNSSDSLVERGAIVSGGSLVNATVSGNIVLVNCKVSNAVITGFGFRQNEILTGNIRLSDKKEPKKRAKNNQPLLFDVSTSQLPNTVKAVENY